ncbi:hypothetical protein ACQP2E_15790 [Actinoplanes sp. CA-015351]|uniref:hypothetical protein n=1 Tax=Actinoplanes sp. CA-015351 TaxID=3239897 RepID=UPI003D999060
MTRRNTGGSTPWESLTPWEKAVQWRESAPEISTEIIDLARSRAIHERELEKSRAAHEQKMDTRLWYTQMANILVSCFGSAALAITVVVLGSNSAALFSVASVSAGLMGASFVASRSIRTTWRRGRQQQQQTEETPPE